VVKTAKNIDPNIGPSRFGAVVAGTDVWPSLQAVWQLLRNHRLKNAAVTVGSQSYDF
jgi:hypothetical protein